MINQIVPMLTMLLFDTSSSLHFYETMTTVNVGDCKRIVAEFRDADKAPLSFQFANTVNVSGAGIAVSTDSNCSSAVNSFVVAQGQSRFMFYIKTDQRNRLSLDVSAQGVQTASLPVHSLDMMHYTGAAYYVATTGSDANSGSINAPFKTLLHALSQVTEGDAIFLREGQYTTTGNGPTIRHSDILIRSMPGETVKLIHQNTNLQYSNLWFFKDRGRVHGLDITGGFYGVKFDGADSVLSNSVIHHVDADGVKIVPEANDAVIWNNEIYRTRQNSSNGQGIDSVNADRLLIENNYVHDIYNNEGVIADIAMKCKGGGTGCVFRHNRIENVGIGIAIGQSTDGQFFDSVSNPYNYESIDGLAYNNLIRNTRYAGIGFWSALNGRAYNNTLVDVARDGQAGIHLDKQNDYRNTPSTSKFNKNIRVKNNIVALHPDNTNSAVEDIKVNSMPANNLSLISEYNLYFDPNRTAVFWDQTDYPNRNTRTYDVLGWMDLLGTTGSLEGNPDLNMSNDYRPNVNSPAIDAGTRIEEFIDDFSGNMRDPLKPDIGAHEN